MIPHTKTDNPALNFLQPARRLASVLYRLTHHDPMAVNCTDTKLSHAPRFVADRLNEVNRSSAQHGVIGVDVVNHPIGEIGMIAHFAGGQRIRAMSHHNAAFIAL